MPYDYMSEEHYEEMWYVDVEGAWVQQVKCYPRGDTDFWVPSLKLTCRAGFSLFNTRMAAILHGIAEANRKMSHYEGIVQRFQRSI